MTKAIHVRMAGRRGVARACAITLAILTTMLLAFETGWHPPLPSAWMLVAVAITTKIGGPIGGVGAASMSVVFASYTDGFTVGPSPGVSVWGLPSQRVLAFALAAATIVALVHRWVSSGRHGPPVSNVWGETSDGDSDSWLIAELEGDATVRRVNASGASMLGHTPSELQGRSFMAMTHAPDREQLAIALARLRRGRRTEPVSVRLLTARGGERSFVGRAFRVSEAGHVVVTAAIPEHSVQRHPPSIMAATRVSPVSVTPR